MIRDRDDGQGRARAKSHSRETRRQTAFVGKPFERASRRRAVDNADTDATHNAGDVKHPQRVGDRVDVPCKTSEDATDDHDDFRTKAVHQVRFQENGPGLKNDKEGEGDLDCRQLGVELLGERVYKQCPTVLKIGDRDHAKDADDQHKPTPRVLHLGWRHACARHFVAYSVDQLHQFSSTHNSRAPFCRAHR